MNIRFETMNHMWEYFKALKARERELGNAGLEVEGTKLWITPDKPVAVRNRDKLVRKVAAFLRTEFTVDDAAVEIDWKLSLVWMEAVRLARVHRETGLVEFNLKVIADKGKETTQFLARWDAFRKQMVADQAGW